MVFYRNLVQAAFDINPDEMMKAVANEVMNFEMPGANMANFRKNSTIIAKAGIYDLRLHHDEVVSPILRFWKVFERTDFGPVGEQAREELAQFLVGSRRAGDEVRGEPRAHARPGRRPRPGADRGDGARTLRSSGPHRGQVPSPDALSRFVAPARRPSGPPLGATRHHGLMRLATWNVNSIRSRADRAAFLQRTTSTSWRCRRPCGTTSSRR